MTSYRDYLNIHSVFRKIEDLKRGDILNYFNVPIRYVFAFETFNQKVSKMIIDPFNVINVNVKFDKKLDMFLISVSCGDQQVNHPCDDKEITCLITSITHRIFV